LARSIFERYSEFSSDLSPPPSSRTSQDISWRICVNHPKLTHSLVKFKRFFGAGLYADVLFLVLYQSSFAQSVCIVKSNNRAIINRHERMNHRSDRLKYTRGEHPTQEKSGITKPGSMRDCAASD
jgi:hypothetical protein